MLKVLIITSTVTQSISIGKIATEYNAYLKEKGHETKVVYLDSDNSPSVEYRQIRRNIFTKIYCQLTLKSNFKYHWAPIALSRIKKIISKYKPDIIQLIQPWPGYIDNEGLFKLIGTTEIPCVYTMIDENAYLGNCDNAYNCQQFYKGCHLCGGQNAKENFEDYKGLWNTKSCRNLSLIKEHGYEFIRNICFVAPTWVVNRAKKSYLLSGRKFYAVDEFVNNKTVFIPQKAENIKWNKMGINPDKIIILNVARYTNVRKGVRCFVELAQSLIADERFIFVNIGFDGDTQFLPKNYVALPFLRNQIELSEFYTVADLLVITSMSDTMPNVCLEALSCGTPVCGFDVTGIPFVADSPLGVFVEKENIEQLKEVVSGTNKKTKELAKECREYALRRYSPDVYGDRMVEIYHNMLNEERN